MLDTDEVGFKNSVMTLLIVINKIIKLIASARIKTYIINYCFIVKNKTITVIFIVVEFSLSWNIGKKYKIFHDNEMEYTYFYLSINLNCINFYKSL